LLAILPLFGNLKTPYEKEVYSFVIARFGYKPRQIKFFLKALNHRSVANINQEMSNERLEFLGDAILDAVVAEMLYTKYPNEDEGYLTKIKSKIVNRRTLGLIGREMEISRVLRYNQSRTIKMETIEGNAFEALIGAIYLDGGLKSVKNSMENHIFKKYIDLNTILEEEIDFKSRLFIWSQKNHLDLVFEVISEENRGAEWIYIVRVLIGEMEYGRGIGSSKKRAEQAASKETLELIGLM
jgi:ribonuclease III